MPEQQEARLNEHEPRRHMKGRMHMNNADTKGLAGYNAGVEEGRLHRGLGLIEFARTKEILLEELPPPPAVICDIGGAYGEYAFWLAEFGYEVHLFDLAETHIRMAKKQNATVCASLAGMEVADARRIDRPDDFADAILLFGPLYHIAEAEERGKCLVECMRLLKPGGKLFTASITPFSTTLKYTSMYDVNPELDRDDVYRRLTATVQTGLHMSREIGMMYFHRPEELRLEVKRAGFEDVELRGVIGPCWIIRSVDEAWKDPRRREAILRIVRLLEKEESLMGFSTHFISISRKPD